MCHEEVNVKVVKAKDGTPVMMAANDHRKGTYPGGQTKREELKHKGLLGKIPKSEQRLLTLRQREGLKNFIEAGLDPSKKAECADRRRLRAWPKRRGQPSTTSWPSRSSGSASRRPSTRPGSTTTGSPASSPRGSRPSIRRPSRGYDPETGDITIPKDYNAIARFLKEAIDLHDLRPATKIDKIIDQRTVTIQLTADDGVAFAKFKRMRQEALVETGVQGS